MSSNARRPEQCGSRGAATELRHTRSIDRSTIARLSIAIRVTSLTTVMQHTVCQACSEYTTVVSSSVLYSVASVRPDDRPTVRTCVVRAVCIVACATHTRPIRAAQLQPRLPRLRRTVLSSCASQSAVKSTRGPSESDLHATGSADDVRRVRELRRRGAARASRSPRVRTGSGVTRATDQHATRSRGRETPSIGSTPASLPTRATCRYDDRTVRGTGAVKA